MRYRHDWVVELSLFSEQESMRGLYVLSVWLLGAKNLKANYNSLLKELI